MTGNEIKEYRLRMQMTQEDLAHYLGVTSKTVYRFERKREVPTLLCWAIVGLVNHLRTMPPRHGARS